MNWWRALDMRWNIPLRLSRAAICIATVCSSDSGAIHRSRRGSRGRFLSQQDMLNDANAFHVRLIIWHEQRNLGRFADPMEWLRQAYRAPPALDGADATVSRETLKPYLAEALFG
jgi:hypothetical protein